MLFPGFIYYSILPDGTCSHCGRDAEILELPWGDVTYGGCTACDEYNTELGIDAGIAKEIWQMEKNTEEFLRDG